MVDKIGMQLDKIRMQLALIAVGQYCTTLGGGLNRRMLPREEQCPNRLTEIDRLR